MEKWFVFYFIILIRFHGNGCYCLNQKFKKIENPINFKDFGAGDGIGDYWEKYEGDF